eukprot:2251786-Pleurochrysis_carterae.AAC.3
MARQQQKPPSAPPSAPLSAPPMPMEYIAAAIVLLLSIAFFLLKGKKTSTAKFLNKQRQAVKLGEARTGCCRGVGREAQDAIGDAMTTQKL